ncbi:MAG: hypothetical protein E6H71_03480 [Betaproteobacteria bacterium]|nr:MAG: hypothetical protein E6H71_03480 [Betaproteobacteria bacterium]
MQDLSTFFGYAAAINRTTGAYGADVIDPICHDGPDNNRFIVAITTLHRVGTTSAFNGKNTIDVAVSNTGNPAGAWTIYRGASGKGAIAFTVIGSDYYPSAGYALIDASGSVGDTHVAAQGLGPADGFTSYKAYVGNPPRTRWGDYGAAVTDGTSVWIASEYIAQTCTRKLGDAYQQAQSVTTSAAVKRERPGGCPAFSFRGSERGTRTPDQRI